MTFVLNPLALGRTVGDWCDELVREYLDRNEVIELDRLKDAVTADAEEVYVTYSGSGIRSQARLEVDDELMHVWAPADNPGAFVVQRGVNATTPAAHDAGALIRINPRWPRPILAAQLGREIRSWPTAVGAVATAEFDVGPSAVALGLTGLDGVDVRRVLRVQRQADDGWPGYPYVLERRQDDGLPALRFNHAYPRNATLRVAVLYAHPVPATIDFTADLGTDYHLSPRLADAAMLGVAGRLLLADEINRTDDRSQPRARLADQVPPGHRLQTGQGLLQERDRLLKTEAEAILNDYAPSF